MASKKYGYNTRKNKFQPKKFTASTRTESNAKDNRSVADNCHKTVEQLIILNDICKGTMARLYQCIHFSSPPVVSTMPEKHHNLLSRWDDNDATSGMPQIHDDDWFSKEIQQLTRETEFVYNAILDMYHVSKEIEELLKRVSHSIVKLDFKLTADLAVRICTLYANLVKLYVLASRVASNTDARVAIMVHSMIPSSAHLPHVIKTLIFELKDPFQKLREIVPTAVCLAIKGCLWKGADCFSKWINVDNVKQLLSQQFELFTMAVSGTDSLCEATRLTASPETRGLLFSASYDSDFAFWVASLVLVFPEELSSSDVSHLCTLLLTKTHSVVVFRDEIICIQHAIDQELKALQHRTSNNPSNIKMQQETILAAQKWKHLCHDTKLNVLSEARVMNQHREIQKYVVECLETVLLILAEFPGAIPVKLPVLMTLLHLARNEVVWCAQHVAGHAKRKAGGAADFTRKFWTRHFKHVGELLHLSRALHQKIDLYNEVTYDYYAKLVDIDLVEVTKSIHECIDGSALGGSSAKIALRLCEELAHEQKKQFIVSKRKYEHIRLDVYRLQHDMSMTMAVQLTSGLKEQMLRALTDLTQDTKFAASLIKELDKCNPFGDLWWFIEDMKPLFELFVDTSAAVGRISKKRSDFSAAAIRQSDATAHGTVSVLYGRYWYLFLSICEAASRNVHHDYIQELKQINIMALRCMEWFITRTCKSVAKCLRHLLVQEMSMRKQFSLETIGRFLRQSLRKFGKLACPVIAGEESFFSSAFGTVQFNPCVRPLYEFTHLMCELLRGFESAGDKLKLGYGKRLTAHEVFPCAYLYETVEAFVRQELFGSRGGDGHVLRRPTRMKLYFDVVFMTVNRLDECIADLQLGKMMKRMIYEECYVSGIARKRRNCFAQVDYSGKWISQVVGWYTKLLESCYPVNGSDDRVQKCAGIIYGTVDQSWHSYADLYGVGFWSDAHAVGGGALGDSGANLQDYCGKVELKALCGIIGPHGVRLMHWELGKMVIDSLNSLMNALGRNVNYQKIVSGFAHSGLTRDVMDKVVKDRHAQKFMGALIQHGTRIGSILMLMEWLDEALAEVCKRHEPFLFGSLKLVDETLASVADRADGIGGDCGDADQLKLLAKNVTELEMRYGFEGYNAALKKMLVNAFTNVKGSEAGGRGTNASSMNSPKSSTASAKRSGSKQAGGLAAGVESMGSVNVGNMMCDMLVAIGGVFLQTAHWEKIKYDPRVGNLTNNGFALAHAANKLLDVFEENVERRVARKEKFVELVAATSMYQVRGGNVKDASNFVLFADYFVNISGGDLSTAVLYDLGVGDAVRAEYIKVFASFDDRQAMASKVALDNLGGLQAAMRGERLSVADMASPRGARGSDMGSM